MLKGRSSDLPFFVVVAERIRSYPRYSLAGHRKRVNNKEMSVTYHVVVDKEREGPLTQFQVRDRIDAGEFDSANLAWTRGMDEWKPLGEFREFGDVFARASPPSERSEESEFESDIDDAFGPVPPGKDSGESISAEEAAETGERTWMDAAEEPQPFRLWTRVGARVIDTILLFTCAITLFSLAGTGAIMGLGLFFPFVVVALTFVIEAGLLCSFGTTPGKALLGIEVRDSEGQILSWGAAFRRSLLVWLRGVGLGHPLFAGILMLFCYFEVKRTGTILWDREQNLRITYREPKPIALGVAAAILFGFFSLVAASGVVENTMHIMRTGEIPEGMELPEGFEWPGMPSEKVPAPGEGGDKEFDGYPSA